MGLCFGRILLLGVCISGCALAPANEPQRPAQEAPPQRAGVDSKSLHLGTVDLPDSAAWQLMSPADDDYLLAWRPLGADLKRNEYLELEVRLLRQGQPLEGAELAVLGWMPEHGHGFGRRTEVESLGAGRFHVKGVLFHMRGAWQLTFDVSRGARVDKLVFDLEF